MKINNDDDNCFSSSIYSPICLHQASLASLRRWQDDLKFIFSKEIPTDVPSEALTPKERPDEIDIFSWSQEDKNSIFSDTEASALASSMNQNSRWQQKFDDLKAFKSIYNHCNVPTRWEEDFALAQWVKRQRYQYKLKKSGLHSNMIDEREEALTNLGFVWESPVVVWEERLSELREFRAKYGHGNVPTIFSANPKLGTWAKCQRRQYKLYLKHGTHSNMTSERVAKLLDLGFVFTPRRGKRAREVSTDQP